MTGNLANAFRVVGEERVDLVTYNHSTRVIKTAVRRACMPSGGVYVEKRRKKNFTGLYTSFANSSSGEPIIFRYPIRNRYPIRRSKHNKP